VSLWFKFSGTFSELSVSYDDLDVRADQGKGIPAGSGRMRASSIASIVSIVLGLIATIITLAVTTGLVTKQFRP